MPDMARAELPVINQVPNAGTTLTLTSRVVGDGYFIDTDGRTGVGDVKLPELLQVFVRNPGGTPLTVTVEAGDPPALAHTYGPIVRQVAAGAIAVLGPFESSRVQKRNGQVHLNLSATAEVAAHRFPRNT